MEASVNLIFHRFWKNDGYYAVWPEDLVGKANDGKVKPVEAEYSRWTESIVGTEVINDAKIRRYS